MTQNARMNVYIIKKKFCNNLSAKFDLLPTTIIFIYAFVFYIHHMYIRAIPYDSNGARGIITTRQIAYTPRVYIYMQRDRASPRSQGLYTQRGVLSRAAALYRRFPQCTSIFAIKIAPVFSLPSGAV